MCKLCLPGPRKGREKGASQGGRKAKGRWGQSMFVMARIANENKEWLLAFLAVGCRWFCACVWMLNRLPSLKQCLGFDALRELRGLCDSRVAEVSRRLSFCFCFLWELLIWIDIWCIQMCNLCLAGPRKGWEKGASQGSGKAKGRWGQSMLAMTTMVPCVFGCGLLVVSFFSDSSECLTALSPSLWNKDFGFDALRELRGLCDSRVAEVRRSLQSYWFE